MESFQAEIAQKRDISSAFHKIDSEEADALKSGTTILADALGVEARKAAADPQYLDKTYGQIKAEVNVPINDGSGEKLYLRGMLYGVEIDHRSDTSEDKPGISMNQFKEEQIEPAALTALERMLFTGKVSGPVDLLLSDDARQALEVSATITDIEAFRLNKNGDTPQSLAESITADVFPLVINQPTRERWLNALHNDAVRLSVSSVQWQNSLKEKLADFQARGFIPNTQILPGSQIDIKLFDAKGKMTVEMLASPDKPTSYTQY